MLDPAALEYGDTVQIWDRASVVFTAYSWNGGAWEDGDLNEVGSDIADIDIPNGMGVITQTTNPAVFAGEVDATGNATVSVFTGLNLASSKFPVPFDLDKCDFSALDYGDVIQVWDTVGFAWVAYAWNGVGFEDGDLNDVSGVIAQPGEAFFIGVANNTTYIQESPL